MTDPEPRTEPSTESSTEPRPRIARNVVALGLVSLLTDASTEIVVPLLPLYLSALGAGAGFVGLVEGLADATASVVKGFAGWLADRLGRRKPLVFAGYGLSGVTRPLMAMTTLPVHVLGVRFLDRVGKGVRGAPRDALIADSTDPRFLGRAFGLHRAMDHVGAWIGPLVAFFLLETLLEGGRVADAALLRRVFWVAAVPAVLAVVVLAIAVREVEPREGRAPRRPLRVSLTPFERPFRRWVLVLGLFTLANSSDAFLVLRASELGVDTRWIPLLWALLSLTKSLSAVPGGAWSDRVGRRRALATGWTLYALTYLGFAFAREAWHAWALFAVYGVSFGFTEGTEKAIVADVVAGERRSTAYGVVGFWTGVAALPASLWMGSVWQHWSSRAAFAVCAGIAACAVAALPVALRAESSRRRT